MPTTRSRGGDQKKAQISAVAVISEQELVFPDVRTKSTKISVGRKSGAASIDRRKKVKLISATPSPTPKLDEVDGPVSMGVNSTERTDNAAKTRNKNTVDKASKSGDSRDETERSADFNEEVSLQGSVVHVVDRCKSSAVNVRKRKSANELPPASSKRSKENKAMENVEVSNNSETEVRKRTSVKNSSKHSKEVAQKQEQKNKSPTVSSNTEQIYEKKQVKRSSQPGGQKVGDKLKEKCAAGGKGLGNTDFNKSADRTVNSFEVKTEDSSSSDSDFEEVETHYRTPESSCLSSVHSDSGICRKLEDSFSDMEHSQENSFSITASRTSVSNSSSSEKTLPSGNCNIENDKSEEKTRVAKNTSGQSSRNKSDKKNKGGKKKQGSAGKVTESSNKSKSRKVIESPKKETSAGGGGENDIMAMLMQMEGQAVKAHQPVKRKKDQPSTSGLSARKKAAVKKKGGARLNSDSSEESEWEEVEDYKHSPVKSQIPDAPVEITIDDPGMMRKKREKKKFDWQAYVQRRIKRLAKEIQVDMHKVNLLCLLAHGMQQNSICSDTTLCATALSVVPPPQLEKSIFKFDSDSLLVLVRWFSSRVYLAQVPVQNSLSLARSSQLMRVIRDGLADEPRLLVMVLVALLRSVGFNVRLVMSLRPLPLKNSQSQANKSEEKQRKGEKVTTNSTSKKSAQAMGNQKAKKSSTKSGDSGRKVPKSAGKSGKQAGVEADRKRKQASRNRKAPEDSSSSSDDSSDDEMGGPSGPKRRLSDRPKKTIKPSTSRKGGSSDSDVDELQLSSDASNFSDEEEVKKKKVKRAYKGKGKSSVRQISQKKVTEDESDAEFDCSFNAKSLTVTKEERQKKKANRKILSSDSSAEKVGKAKSGQDYWLEVFLPAEFRWICVDCIRRVVGKPYDVSASASQPLLYVLGFENDGSVKDITAKYAPQWLSHTRKQRVDSDWWRESLEPYTSANQMMDDQENEDIKNHLMRRPLPTGIGDFKNHPLYALRRHLLKYEAIYPESSIPVGYIRREPVYARESVHTLHSRDNWLREARVVRIGETAYKMVKSRKRWNRARDNPEELDLELFGHWQTEDYIPPPAVDGKVPKNEYGNVELFQPSMLPGGTVHLRVNALNRVAKKLGIDVAAAMTGWDHHCGFSHPVLDGWVVCEEHKDILLAAWEEDQEIQKQREEERREKRVLNNWTTLVRGLLIKEKLKKKFNLEDKKVEPEKKKAAKPKKGEVATDVQHAWPAKQQRKQKSKKDNPLPQPTHYVVETM